MQQTEQLFESLFNRTPISVDTRNFLTAVTKEHPYFTPAQFYLLKLSDTAGKDVALQAAKTSLLFNNPFWLNFQLNYAESIPSLTENIDSPGENNLDKANERESEIAFQTNEIAEIQSNIVTPEPVVVPNLPASAMEPDDNIATNEALQTEGIAAIDQHTPEPIAAKEEQAEAFQANLNAAIVVENADDQVHTEPAIETATIKELMLETTVPEEEQQQAKAFAITEENQPTPAFVQQENSPAELQPTAINTVENEAGNEPDYSTEEDTEPMILKVDFNPKATTTEETLSYQPLFTSDYFASLGIRINENGIPVDRLGKQLKSFTDWLKIMKKIHPDQLLPQEGFAETNIQELAEKSNKKGEILTEAMAEVLMQQGKKSKALEVYQKLSLLNPSKSAYFAAKIDEIKR